MSAYGGDCMPFNTGADYCKLAASRGKRNRSEEPCAAKQKKASGLKEQPKAPVVEQRLGTTRNKRPESSRSWDLPHPKWVILPSGMCIEINPTRYMLTTQQCLDFWG